MVKDTKTLCDMVGETAFAIHVFHAHGHSKRNMKMGWVVVMPQFVPSPARFLASHRFFSIASKLIHGLVRHARRLRQPIFWRES